MRLAKFRREARPPVSVKKDAQHKECWKLNGPAKIQALPVSDQTSSITFVRHSRLTNCKLKKPGAERTHLKDIKGGSHEEEFAIAGIRGRSRIAA